MKILMVVNDTDNRLFALFAFKDLNVAHSMDFVSNSNNSLWEAVDLMEFQKFE